MNTAMDQALEQAEYEVESELAPDSTFNLRQRLDDEIAQRGADGHATSDVVFYRALEIATQE